MKEKQEVRELNREERERKCPDLRRRRANSGQDGQIATEGLVRAQLFHLFDPLASLLGGSRVVNLR
jgi:hypothetical protein